MASYNGDGIDGEDAEPFIVGVKQDEEDGRWYWYDTRNEDWMYSPDGERFLVDGKDGRTPKLKIEEGYWCISWDNGETWTTTDWKAKGEDAREVFSNVEIFDDRLCVLGPSRAHERERPVRIRVFAAQQAF